MSPTTIYVVSEFDGILKSTNNGATLVQLTKGFAGPVSTALAVDPLKPSTLYFATLPPGAGDSFVTKINSAGTAMLYSTFLGGMLSTADFNGVNATAAAIALDNWRA